MQSFWKTKLSDVEETLSLVKKGKVRTLCKSAGGRDIKMVEYGEKEDFNRLANYNSACGAKNPVHYANKKEKKPVILFVGGIHSLEMEAVVAFNNVIRIIETGKDLTGKTNDFFVDSINEFRLLFIPVMNIDGRVRLSIDSVVGISGHQMHYYSQGTWKDGTLCDWPGCKAVHPILDHVDLLGAYFNDDGVNLMHDNFFLPMAKETTALMQLVDEEAPDYVILLHGGANTTNVLLQPPFVPAHINRKIDELANDIKVVCDGRGLKYGIAKIPDNTGSPPFSFNLTCALHHICGGVSITYESNQSLAEDNRFTCEEILDHHYILFEQTMKKALRDKKYD